MTTRGRGHAAPPRPVTHFAPSYFPLYGLLYGEDSIWSRQREGIKIKESRKEKRELELAQLVFRLTNNIGISSRGAHTGWCIARARARILSKRNIIFFKIIIINASMYIFERKDGPLAREFSQHRGAEPLVLFQKRKFSLCFCLRNNLYQDLFNKYIYLESLASPSRASFCSLDRSSKIIIRMREKNNLEYKMVRYDKSFGAKWYGNEYLTRGYTHIMCIKGMYV